MTKFIEVTDRTGLIPQSRYQGVNDEFALPRSNKDIHFEFVPDSQARIAHPALFGSRSNRKNEV